MLPFKAVAAGDSKIIEIMIGIAPGDRRKGFQAIFGDPCDCFCIFSGNLDLVCADHTAQHSCIGFQIIIVVFHVFGQFFHSGSIFQLVDQCIHVTSFKSGEVAAISGTQVCEQFDPVEMGFLLIAVHVIAKRNSHSFRGDIEIYPFDIFLCIRGAGGGLFRSGQTDQAGNRAGKILVWKRPEEESAQ